jgi:hypothetical protein
MNQTTVTKASIGYLMVMMPDHTREPERSPDSMVSISIRDLQRLTDGSCIQEVTGLACQDCGCDVAAMNALRDLARADAEAAALKGNRP